MNNVITYYDTRFGDRYTIYLHASGEFCAATRHLAGSLTDTVDYHSLDELPAFARHGIIHTLSKHYSGAKGGTKSTTGIHQ